MDDACRPPLQTPTPPPRGPGDRTAAAPAPAPTSAAAAASKTLVETGPLPTLDVPLSICVGAVFFARGEQNLRLVAKRTADDKMAALSQTAQVRSTSSLRLRPPPSGRRHIGAAPCLMQSVNPKQPNPAPYARQTAGLRRAARCAPGALHGSSGAQGAPSAAARGHRHGGG